MSGIHCLGEATLANALARYDERYEGTNGCPHLRSEKGDWTAPMETKVVAYNERDSFGPGEINLLCLDCDREAEKEEWTCDWCHHRGTDVSGLTDHETHEEYMVCDLCRELAHEGSTFDSLMDELHSPEEFENPRSPEEIRRDIEATKATIARLRKQRDERKTKEEAEHKTPQ